MAQPDHHEKPFQELITRLEQELQQSRVSIEDAQAEIAALSDLNSHLKSRLAAAETARAEAEARELRVRDEAAKSMELVTRSAARGARQTGTACGAGRELGAGRGPACHQRSPDGGK